MVYIGASWFLPFWGRRPRNPTKDGCFVQSSAIELVFGDRDCPLETYYGMVGVEGATYSQVLESCKDSCQSEPSLFVKSLKEKLGDGDKGLSRLDIST